MASQKIPVFAVINFAEQIAAYGFPREKAIAVLKKTFEDLGAEVDFSPPPATSGIILDFSKTKPMAPAPTGP